MKEYIIAVGKEYNGNIRVKEELIRCKDCKEYAEWGDSKVCMRLGSYGNTTPYDFCSRAERKEHETD